MNYAKNNHIGYSPTSRAKKAKATARTAERLRPLDAETQRRRGNTERQTQVSACPNASDGFLKVSFLPKGHQTKTVKACKGTAKMQKDFYASLSRLAVHYATVPMPSHHLQYPYNMALAVWDMDEKLKNSVLDFSELRVLQDCGKTYLLSEERYSTGTTLYYIPIEPIYLMLHDPKYNKNAQLLISVCSYLYHIADIPYFRQENSYLYWLYEMHREWTEQDEDREENARYVREFDKAELIGDIMEQKIFNRMNLQIFEKRLSTFKSRDAFDIKCSRLGGKAFGLYRQYPSENIFRNAPIHSGEEQDTETESIGMDKYISFISHTHGWLYESLAESINNEFNEYAQMDEPTIVKCFDGTETTDSSLDFESRLFALLDDLCELLYNYSQHENE